MRIMSSINCFQHANLLQIDTGSYASFTQNAFVHVSNYRWRGIINFIAGRLDVSECVIINSIFFCKILQFAVPISKTRITFTIMLA